MNRPLHAQLSCRHHRNSSASLQTDRDGITTARFGWFISLEASIRGLNVSISSIERRVPRTLSSSKSRRFRQRRTQSRYKFARRRPAPSAHTSTRRRHLDSPGKQGWVPRVSQSVPFSRRYRASCRYPIFIEYLIARYAPKFSVAA